MTNSHENSLAHHYRKAFSDEGKLIDLPTDFLFEPERREEVADAVLWPLLEGRGDGEIELLYVCNFFSQGASLETLGSLLGVATSEASSNAMALLDANLITQRPGARDGEEHLSTHKDIAKRAASRITMERRGELETRFAQQCLLLAPFEPISCLQIAPRLEYTKHIEALRDEFEQTIDRCSSAHPELATELFLTLAHASFIHNKQEALDFLESRCSMLLETLAALDTDHTGYVRILRFHMFAVWGELVFRQTGNSTPFFEALERARALFAPAGMPHEQKLTYHYQRAIMGTFSQTDATPYVEDAHTALELASDPRLPLFVKPQCSRLLARFLSSRGEHEKALHHMMESAEFAKNNGMEGLYAICILSCSLIQTCMRQNDAAIDTASTLSPIFERLEQPRYAHIVNIVLASLHYARGELAKALSFCTESRLHLERHGETHFRRWSLQLSALIELELGNTERALDFQRQLGWPLDPHILGDDPLSNGWLFGVGAIIYHYAGDAFSTQRMWLDVQHYEARFSDLDQSDTFHAFLSYGYMLCREKGDTPHTSMQWEELSRLAGDVEEDRAGSDLANLIKDGLLRFFQANLFEDLRATPNKITLWVDSPSPTRFRVGDGDLVDIQRRAAIRRILTGLLEASTSQPNPTSVPLEEVFELGWPGEQSTFESMKARVYNAISRMRRLGLEDLIIHDGDGYYIARSCDVTIAESAARNTTSENDAV